MSAAPHRQTAAVAPAEDTVGLIEEGEVVLWEANELGQSSAAGSRHVKKLAALSLGGAVLLAVVVGTALATRQAAAPQEADVGSSVGLVGAAELAETFANGFKAAEKLVKDAKQSKDDMMKSGTDLEKIAEEVQDEVATEKPPEKVPDELKHLAGDDLFKKLEKDGNPCPDDEESLAGLCYAKCKDITKGEYPIRTTAFACCREQPCSIFNTKFTSPFKLCSGNDVSGVHEGASCPHAPGDCLRNEELLFGECYMRCAILTDNAFSYRTGPETCCRYQTKMACFDAANTVSNIAFSVGGGVNDPTYNASFGEAHTPLPDLADVLTTTTLPTLPPLPEMPTMPTMPTLAPMPTIPPPPTLSGF